MRFRDAEGRWGPISKTPFFVLPQAVPETPSLESVEVEVEDRLGKVLRSELALESGATASAVAHFATGDAASGPLRVRVRIKDDEEQWGLPVTQSLMALPSFPDAQVGFRLLQDGEIIEQLPTASLDELAGTDAGIVFRPADLPESGEIALEAVVLIDGRVEWIPLQSVLTVVISKDPPRLEMSLDAASGEITLAARNVSEGERLLIEQSEDMKVWTEVVFIKEGQPAFLAKKAMPRFFRARVISEAAEQ